jgi:adenine-specific DNA-methyltransferase
VRKSGIALRQDIKHIATSQDFVLFYAKDINSLKVNKKKSILEGYYLEDEYLSTRGRYKLNKLHRGNIHYFESLDYPIKAPEGTEIWPDGDTNDKRWTWIWSKDKVESGLKNGFIVFKKKGKWSVYFKEYEFVDNEGNQIEITKPYDTLILNTPNEEGIKI